ncbi:MAG: hypothetical protein ACPGEG_01820 [Salibacteraceae bacterium]
MNSKLPDINGYKNRLDIIEKVVTQLEKDLDLNFAIKLSNDPDLAYNELFTQTLPIIKNLANEPLFSFRQLMYRIDVSENKIAEAFNSESNKSEFEIYTHLIIERELQKVVTRLFFSQTLES